MILLSGLLVFVVFGWEGRREVEYVLGEDSRRLMLLGECSECSGGAVNGRVTDRENGNHDYGVEERGETSDSCIRHCEDEGGGFCIR